MWLELEIIVWKGRNCQTGADFAVLGELTVDHLQTITAPSVGCKFILSPRFHPAAPFYPTQILLIMTSRAKLQPKITSSYSCGFTDGN